jgi:hypothetical protein
MGHRDEELRAIFQAWVEDADDTAARHPEWRVKVHAHSRNTVARTGYCEPKERHPDAPQSVRTLSAVIWIYRDDESIPGPAMRELVALAHEFGHALSHMRGEQTPDYKAAVMKYDAKLTAESETQLEADAAALASQPMTEAEQDLVRDEEDRAWEYGREELERRGLTDFGKFDEWRAEAMAIYARNFKRFSSSS